MPRSRFGGFIDTQRRQAFRATDSGRFRPGPPAASRNPPPFPSMAADPSGESSLNSGVSWRRRMSATRSMQNGGSQDLDLVLKSGRRRVRRDRDVVQIDDLEALGVENDPRVRRVLRHRVDRQQHAKGRGDQGGQDDQPLAPPERQQKLPYVERLVLGANRPDPPMAGRAEWTPPVPRFSPGSSVSTLISCARSSPTQPSRNEPRREPTAETVSRPLTAVKFAKNLT